MESLGHTGVSQTLEGSLDKTSLREWHMWLAAGAPAAFRGSLAGPLAKPQGCRLCSLYKQTRWGFVLGWDDARPGALAGA